MFCFYDNVPWYRKAQKNLETSEINWKQPVDWTPFHLIVLSAEEKNCPSKMTKLNTNVGHFLFWCRIFALLFLCNVIQCFPIIFVRGTNAWFNNNLAAPLEPFSKTRWLVASFSLLELPQVCSGTQVGNHCFNLWNITRTWYT